MAYIDNEQINLVRNSVNIVDIISEYVVLTSKGRNFFGVCPFHDDHSPSMSVSSEKQIYTCFSCGATGNVFTFVQNYEHISFVEAVDKIAKKVGINLGIKPKNDYLKTNIIEYDILNYCQKYFVNNLNTEKGIEALKYLNNRGISNELIIKFGIGLSLSDQDALSNLLTNKNFPQKSIIELGISTNDQKPVDTFRNRIMFPIHNHYNQIVGYSGRIYNNEESAKYVNSKASLIFKKSEILYNYHNAKDEVRKEKYIIVVEGFMDVIRLASVGINSVVALMGTAMTKEHIDLLKQLRVPVILCLDNDDAGINATINNGEQLFNQKIDISVIKIEGAKDPDEYILSRGKDAFIKKIDSAVSYLDYRFNYLKSKTNPNNTEEIAEAVNEMIELLNKIDDLVLKELMIKKISDEYSLSNDIISSKIKKVEINDQVGSKIQKQNITAKNKFEKSCEIIIYLIMNNVKNLKYFERKLGYFPHPEYSKLLNEIRYYYEKNHDINLADFMSHINDKSDLAKIVSDIVAFVGDEDHEKNIDDYIKIVEAKIYQDRISKLKSELNNISDYEEKIEIMKKIADLKKVK